MLSCFFVPRETCRKADGTIGPLQALAIGASARAFAASTFLPITVVKTRFEVSSHQCVCVYVWLLFDV